MPHSAELHLRPGEALGRDPGVLQPAIRTILAPTALLLSAVGIGWLVSSGHTDLVVLVGAATGFVLLANRAPGPVAAVLVLVVMNSIPFANLDARIPGGVRIQDCAAIALVALMLANRCTISDPRHRRVTYLATVWSACFIAWWILTAARTVISEEVPPLEAMLFGRDFLYFAVLLPIALRVRIPTRSLRLGGYILTAGLTLYAVGFVFSVVSGTVLTWLLHPTLVGDTGGVTRIYGAMADLSNTFLIFLVALLLSPERLRNRWPLAGLTLLLAVAAMLQLTRANYFALAAALLAGLSIYAIRYGSLTNAVVRIGLIGLTTMAIAATPILGAAESGTGAGLVVSPVVTRVETGFSEVVNSTGTVNYRDQVDEKMLHALGSHWPVGLGFLHPAAKQVSGVPGGTIRNSDTGVFNILMTMGVVGVLLLYLPLGFALRELLRASKGRSSIPRWILCGGFAWLIWAIVGSPTLVVLFSMSGLMLTVLVLTFLAQSLFNADRPAGENAP